MMLREFLLCGAPASAVAPLLQDFDVAVFDASGIHSRIVAVNDAGSDQQRLRVPIVPPSIWTRLTQVVSSERSGSIRWAVVAEDLALFVPLWKHLMPSADVVLPTDASSDTPAKQLADAVRRIL